MMRLVLAALALAMLATACGGSSPKPTPVATSTATSARPNGPGPLEGGFGPAQLPIDVHATVARSSYLPEEPVEFTLSLKNTTNTPVTIRSLPPAVEIIEPLEGAVVYEFAAGSGATTLAPGAEVAQALVWTQVDSTGRPVQPGHYALQVSLNTDRGEYGWRSFLTSGQQDSIFIAHPGGELIRTLAPGVSQDVGGVRITLDSVEFSATATIVHVRAIPPGYDFPEGRDTGPVMPPMSILPFQPEASYQVDDEPQKPGGGGGFQPRQRDIQITWTLDPVPASTHVFRFVVTSLKKFDGPWAFTVDLSAPR